jgi:hypothetical protein
MGRERRETGEGEEESDIIGRKGEVGKERSM